MASRFNINPSRVVRGDAVAKFLRLTGWDKYQHYKQRNPPWIKLHRSILQAHAFILLDDASKLLAFVCIVLAGDSNNKIPLDRDFIQTRAGLQKRPDIRPLIKSGFAEVFEDCQQDASEVLADASKLRQNCPSEKEKEKEVYIPIAPHLDAGHLKPPESSDELSESILKLHPANWHWRNSKAKLQLPQAQCNALIEAIGRSGLDAVLAGTKAYAKYVEKSPGFVVRPERFYGDEAHYLKKLEDWESANGTHQQNSKQSRAQQVLDNNRAAAAAVGWGSTHTSAVEVKGTDFGGNQAVAGEVKRLQGKPS